MTPILMDRPQFWEWLKTTTIYDVRQYMENRLNRDAHFKSKPQYFVLRGYMAAINNLDNE